MPSVDELLNAAEVAEATLTETNDKIEIDADTRTMMIPDTERIFGVMSDEKGERKYFRCKRFVGNGIDLSKLSLRIVFQNASGLDTGRDKYIVTDLATEGEDYVTFSWELSRKVTAYKGTISFIVCAIKTNSDGTITNEWNTTLANGEVLDGLEANGTQKQEEVARDYYNQLEAELLKVANEQKAEIEKKAQEVIETIPSDYTQMQKDVDNLKEDLGDTKHKLKLYTISLIHGYHYNSGNTVKWNDNGDVADKRLGTQYPLTWDNVPCGAIIQCYDKAVCRLWYADVENNIIGFNDDFLKAVTIEPTYNGTSYHHFYLDFKNADDTLLEIEDDFYDIIQNEPNVVDTIKDFNQFIGDYENNNQNLWRNLVDGEYCLSTTGVFIVNPETVRTDYVNIRGHKKIYISNTYAQYCFYNRKKEYITGSRISTESYSTALSKNAEYKEIDIPLQAEFFVVSTRLANKYRFIATFNKEEFVNKCLYNVNMETIIASPSDVNMSGGTFNNGYRMNTGTIRVYRYTTLDRSRMSAIFSCDSDSIIRFGYNSSATEIGDTDADCGLVVVINTSSKTLNVYRWNWATGNPTDLVGKTTFEFDLTDGYNYIITIEKNTIWDITITLQNASITRNSVLIEHKIVFEENIQTKSGYCRCWGCGRFSVVSGSVTLKRLNMFALGNLNPKLYIIGDSYVEHAGRNPLCGYGQRLYEHLNSDVVLSGRGGAKTDNVRKRIWEELSTCRPKYCILEVGMNDSVNTSSASINCYKESMNELISIVKEHGCIPVLTTIPRRLDSDNLTFIEEVNPWIKSLGYKVIDEALVMSNGDGVTQDSSMYQSDLIHPTIEAGKAVFDWIEANLPELIY